VTPHRQRGRTGRTDGGERGQRAVRWRDRAAVYDQQGTWSILAAQMEPRTGHFWGRSMRTGLHCRAANAVPGWWRSAAFGRGRGRGRLTPNSPGTATANCFRDGRARTMGRQPMSDDHACSTWGLRDLPPAAGSEEVSSFSRTVPAAGINETRRRRCTACLRINRVCEIRDPQTREGGGTGGRLVAVTAQKTGDALRAAHGEMTNSERDNTTRDSIARRRHGREVGERPCPRRGQTMRGWWLGEGDNGEGTGMTLTNDPLQRRIGGGQMVGRVEGEMAQR